MRIPILASILLCYSIATLGQIIDSAAIDKIFSRWDKPNVPGCAVGIFQDGKTIFAKGYGMANLDYNIPNSPSSVFDLASTSKQFTAACIILLAESGKLKLTDKVRNFFPELKENTSEITVQHLLYHTSGIRDYLTLAYFKGLGDDDFYDDKDVLTWLSLQENLNFQPGEEFMYSNSGYWLLGQIVNKVSGMDMSEFARQQIFEPLGMTNTRFQRDMSDIIKNRATGYVPDGQGGYKISMTPLELIGDGGIYSTIDDLKKWDDAYYNSKVFSKNFWTAMTTTGQLNNGDKLDYAAGLMIGKYKGLETISHGGAFVGFRSDMLRFPEQKFSVVVLCNRADANPSGLCLRVSDIFLEDKFIVEAPEINPASASENSAPEEAYSLQSFTGKYELKPGLIVDVSIQKDSVHILQTWNNSEYNLARASGNSFHLPGNPMLTFTFSELRDGFTEKLSVNQNGNISHSTRKKEVDFSQINLKIYEGHFYSNELQTGYHIFLKDESLHLKIPENEPVHLTVYDIDQFMAPDMLLRFDKIGQKTTGFQLDAGRIQNITFNKISP